MTMIIGVAVKPKGSRKPFFLMGSDSKRRYLVEDENGNSVMKTEDNYQKIHKFNDKIIALAGRVPNEVLEDLPNFLKISSWDFETTCEYTKDFINDHLSEYEIPKEVGYFRLRTIIGTIEKSYPEMATFTFDTRESNKVNYVVQSQESFGFKVEFIGNTRETINLQLKFKQDNKLKNPNLSYLEVKKYAKEYLSESVKRYPDECNSNFKFEQLPDIY